MRVCVFAINGTHFNDEQERTFDVLWDSKWFSKTRFLHTLSRLYILACISFFVIFLAIAFQEVLWELFVILEWVAVDSCLAIFSQQNYKTGWFWTHVNDPLSLIKMCCLPDLRGFYFHFEPILWKDTKSLGAVQTAFWFAKTERVTNFAWRLRYSLSMRTRSKFVIAPFVGPTVDKGDQRHALATRLERSELFRSCAGAGITFYNAGCNDRIPRLSRVQFIARN